MRGITSPMHITNNVSKETRKIYIIILDSDLSSTTPLKDILIHNGFSVDIANDGNELLALLSARSYDMVILDTTLSSNDGFSILRWLVRNKPGLGLLVRSEYDDKTDRIIALEVGADDCITKSCHWREVLARIRAILRRLSLSQVFYANSAFTYNIAPISEFRFHGWTLDCNEIKLYNLDSEEIVINNIEFRLLKILFSEPGIVKSRDYIAGVVLGKSEVKDHRIIDVYISRLRRKFLQYTDILFIETVRKEGYRSIKNIECHRGT